MLSAKNSIVAQILEMELKQKMAIGVSKQARAWHIISPRVPSARGQVQGQDDGVIVWMEEERGGPVISHSDRTLFCTLSINLALTLTLVCNKKK